MPDSTPPRPTRSAWRWGVPAVCVAAGLLLGVTHSVSGGDEIRGSDAPRLVDLVREAQQSVDRLTAERDAAAATEAATRAASETATARLRATTGVGRTDQRWS